MKLEKKFIIALIILLAIVLIPGIANAAVEYTRTIPSNDGTIKINLTGLEISENKAYEFALVRQGGTPESWFSIDDGYTSTDATITLGSAIDEIVEVLKVTDTGFLYMREKDDATGTYVLESYKINLKLPYLQSLPYEKKERYYDVTGLLYGSIGDQYSSIGATTTYVQWKKITDRALIEEYLNIKNNNEEITELEESLPEPPTTGYTLGKKPEYLDKNDGLYLLWVKRTGENCKDVYSCIVHDGLLDATRVEEYIAGVDVEKPTVTSISVTRPKSGTYKTGQIVEIKVTFSETITGTTVPTLKIRFGTSEERILTNGTITENTIVYSYEIVDGDKGQLATVSYMGGTIKDAAGNSAELSCPVITGNAIKANVENDGQPGENPEENPEENPGDNPDDNSGYNGDTLPNTGEGIIAIAIIALLGVGVVLFKKNIDYKEIR